MMGASTVSPMKKNGNTKTPPLAESEMSSAPTPNITKPITSRRISLIFTSVPVVLFVCLNNSILNRARE